ncbi:uncharacterized protein LOC132277462 [Cornus florida]|uniref:uncharacterized protein LOC132277462 n=1 Tax=Cornus florida TaxID=4283 RepID=UPI0028A03615|nr:uncharacterized protein LOC132277462 [Cornus florida]
MTMKESFEYYTHVGASDGFDVPEFPNVFALGIIIPYLKPDEEFEHHESLKELNCCSKLAVDHYDMKNYANYEFVKVVKANSQAVAGAMFYITFEARDKDKDDAPVEMFEAKVYSGIKETNMRVLTCRPKKVTIIDEDVRCNKEEYECDSNS